MKKFLIVGLGNPGAEYENTRHNIGFLTLDAFAKASNVVFEPGRYAMTAEARIKGRIFRLIKPTTFMNLSGIAVRYWMQEEKIPIENVLVVVDDLAIPFGSLPQGQRVRCRTQRPKRHSSQTWSQRLPQT